MKVTLTPRMQQRFFANSYPARMLTTLDRMSVAKLLQKPDDIICYNSRAKLFNVFASKDVSKCGAPGTSALFFTYDQDTDELEIICAALEIAGRKLLFRGDVPEQPGQVQAMGDFYREHQEELMSEAEAISKRIQDRNRSGGGEPQGK